MTQTRCPTKKNTENVTELLAVGLPLQDWQ